MRFSLPIRPLLFAAFLLATAAPGFNVSLRTLRGLEGEVTTAAYVEANGERVSMVVPNGWQAGAAAQTNALSLNLRSGESPITVAFHTQDASPLLAEPQALRQTVVPFLHEATLLDEFPAFSGYGPGRGMDFSFALQGHPMLARLVVIPLAQGFASFYVAGAAEQKATFLRALGTTLTSFRSSPKNAREESITPGSQAKKGERPKTRIASAVQTFEVLQTEPPPPPKPVLVHKSIFEGREDYVRLGLVSGLLIVLVSRTLARQRREAEIRALQGGYLSDGTAIARFNMPDLFAPAPEVPEWPWALPTQAGLLGEDRGQISKTKTEEFLEQAPTYLAALRKAIQKLGQAGNEAEWCEALVELPPHVTALRERANFWAVRPVWQMSSALELLVQRLAEKPKDATPSTLLTIRAATDMLHALCVPGIRPNLVIDPPIQVLAVDDDALCLRAMVFALQKASLVADVANTGQQSLALASRKAYDIIFMDIQMPEMDGLTACQKIRETELNAETPVVFVTIQSDFHTRAQSNILGSTDFMAKPFLIFELTVKALMFTMRKRLGMCGASQVATVPAAVPARAAAPVPVATSSESPTGQAPALETAAPRMEAVPLPPDFKRDFFVEAPDYVTSLRKLLEAVTVSQVEPTRSAHLATLQLWTQTLATQARLRELPVTARLASALEALLKRLHQNPKMVAASTLNTVSKALSLLATMCVRGIEEGFAADAPVKILVVEDEPLTRRAVVGALQLAYEKPDSAGDGDEALALAGQKPYDVIFTDVEMPGLDGFELCTRLRASGPNRTTPVVFITSHSDASAYAQAAQSGGTDFIAKPFHPLEIAVKALTFAWEGRLRKIKDGPTTPDDPNIQSQNPTLADRPASAQEPVAQMVA